MSEKENSYAMTSSWDAMSLSQETLVKLRTQVSGNLVEKRPGPDGKELVYLAGYRVIDQHNEIWVHGNWWYQCQEGGPQHHVVDMLDPVTGNIRRLEYYSAVVTIYRGGIAMFRDEGFGSVDESPFGARARVVLGNHKKARQGSITDGLKRASRGFGNQFGNSLYDDEFEIEMDPDAPACPMHGAGPHVRPSRWDDGNDFYCATSLPEGGYCVGVPRVPTSGTEVVVYAPSADGPVAMPSSAAPASGPGVIEAEPTKGEMLDEYFRLVAQLGFDSDVIRAGYRQKYGRDIEDSSVKELGDLVQMANSKLASRHQGSRSA